MSKHLSVDEYIARGNRSQRVLLHLHQEHDATKPRACQVCGRSDTVFLDHDHETDQFRAWLCRSCNAPGMEDLTVSTLMAAAQRVLANA